MVKPPKRLNIVLVAPRIAANVGNAARTCEALNASLSLVGPFGFILDEKKLKRSSVGYWENLKPEIYKDAEDFWSRFAFTPQTEIYWATKRAPTLYSSICFGQDVCLIFGNEEEGVADEFWQAKNLQENSGLPAVVSCRIPMANVRCLNLATSVGIVGYEVFRQWGTETNEDSIEGAQA
jgi:tRNA (cytidine/uridine-2'-O-)-methyltransferase